jgi:hypothetical protein
MSESDPRIPDAVRDAARAFGRMGGRARAKALTAEARRAIAVKGGKARAAQRKARAKRRGRKKK